MSRRQISERFRLRLARGLFARLPRQTNDGRLAGLATHRTARGLIRDGRFAEADAILLDALALDPTNVRLAEDYALSAHSRGLYEKAIARWTRAREVGGSEPFCAACLAANLRAVGRHAEAQALIDDMLALHPDSTMALTEAARLAGARHRTADALRLWRRAITVARPHPDWLQGYAQSLFVLGDLARADRALASARRQFPDHQGLLAAHGAIAVADQDWPRAVAFWTDYRRRYPDDATGWEQLGIAVQGASMSLAADVAIRVAVPVPPSLARIAIVDDEPMRRLVMRFESIGDSCEMGLVQRRYGAEPLGLLRWNDVGLDNLVTALAHGLEGMGQPENTEIMTAANGEFYVKDTRWSLAMHTFLFAGHVERDVVYKKMCRRIAYLRDKLLEDLAAADKIFVYRSSAIDADGLEHLHRALRNFGPVTLLGAQPVGSQTMRFLGRRAGDIERLGDGLFMGFLGRPGTDALGNWDIPFDDWTGIFTKALAEAGENVTV